jgi:hypothetical protein
VAGDAEEALRVLMVRTLPRAARGEPDAVSAALAQAEALAGVAEDPWLRYVDACNNVFEVARIHRDLVDEGAWQRMLARYEGALARTLAALR